MDIWIPNKEIVHPSIIAPSIRDIEKLERARWNNKRKSFREFPITKYELAWSQVGSATSANGTTSATVTKPTGTSNDDRVIISVLSIPRTNTPTCTGFNNVVSFVYVTDDVRFTVFERLSSSDGSNYTVNVTSATLTIVTAETWRGGVTSGTLVDAVGAGNSGASNPIQANAISPANSTDLLLFRAGYVGPSGGSTSPPSGMTETLDADVGGTGIIMYNAYQILTASGSTGNKSTSPTGTAGWLAVLVALNLATAAGSGKPYLYYAQQRALN